MSSTQLMHMGWLMVSRRCGWAGAGGPSVEPRQRRALLLLRRVELRGRAHQRFQRLFVDLVALAEVDGAAGAAFQAGVEQLGRVRKSGAVGEGGLHVVLVRL